MQVAFLHNVGSLFSPVYTSPVLTSKNKITSIQNYCASIKIPHVDAHSSITHAVVDALLDKENYVFRGDADDARIDFFSFLMRYIKSCIDDADFQDKVKRHPDVHSFFQALCYVTSRQLLESLKSPSFNAQKNKNIFLTKLASIDLYLFKAILPIYLQHNPGNAGIDAIGNALVLLSQAITRDDIKKTPSVTDKLECIQAMLHKQRFVSEINEIDPANAQRIAILQSVRQTLPYALLNNKARFEAIETALEDYQKSQPPAALDQALSSLNLTAYADNLIHCFTEYQQHPLALSVVRMRQVFLPHLATLYIDNMIEACACRPDPTFEGLFDFYRNELKKLDNKPLDMQQAIYDALLLKQSSAKKTEGFDFFVGLVKEQREVQALSEPEKKALAHAKEQKAAYESLRLKFETLANRFLERVARKKITKKKREILLDAASNAGKPRSEGISSAEHIQLFLLSLNAKREPSNRSMRSFIEDVRSRIVARSFLESLLSPAGFVNDRLNTWLSVATFSERNQLAALLKQSQTTENESIALIQTLFLLWHIDSDHADAAHVRQTKIDELAVMNVVDREALFTRLEQHIQQHTELTIQRPKVARFMQDVSCKMEFNQMLALKDCVFNSHILNSTDPAKLYQALHAHYHSEDQRHALDTPRIFQEGSSDCIQVKDNIRWYDIFSLIAQEGAGDQPDITSAILNETQLLSALEDCSQHQSISYSKVYLLCIIPTFQVFCKKHHTTDQAREKLAALVQGLWFSALVRDGYETYILDQQRALEEGKIIKPYEAFKNFYKEKSGVDFVPSPYRCLDLFNKFKTYYEHNKEDKEHAVNHDIFLLDMEQLGRDALCNQEQMGDFFDASLKITQRIQKEKEQALISAREAEDAKKAKEHAAALAALCEISTPTLPTWKLMVSQAITDAALKTKKLEDGQPSNILNVEDYQYKVIQELKNQRDVFQAQGITEGWAMEIDREIKKRPHTAYTLDDLFRAYQAYKLSGRYDLQSPLGLLITPSHHCLLEKWYQARKLEQCFAIHPGGEDVFTDLEKMLIIARYKTDVFSLHRQTGLYYAKALWSALIESVSVVLCMLIVGLFFRKSMQDYASTVIKTRSETLLSQQKCAFFNQFKSDDALRSNAIKIVSPAC